jgi:hypothetical protein
MTTLPQHAFLLHQQLRDLVVVGDEPDLGVGMFEINTKA